VRSADEACQDPGELEPGALRAALAALRDDDQEILRLVAWDGLAPAELAVALGCSPNAARTRLHRARSRLAARLGIGPDLQRYARAGHKQGDGLDSVEV
jgi:DNA-directed RNA polymerase specialized sigma24 family protein